MQEAVQTDFEVVRRQKVYEAVAEQIERLIISKLKPGDKLPSERELSETLKVSRGSIRDAIRSLELLGLVEPRQGAGTIVRETAVDTMRPFAEVLKQRREAITDLLEFREMLEPPLTARAAKHVNGEQILHLDKILRRQEQKLAAHEPAIEEDTEFHYTIALASGNGVVMKVMDLVMDLLRDTRQRALQVPGRSERSLNGHRRIWEALSRRDAEAAEIAMRRHIREVQHIVMKNFERAEASSR